MRYCMIITTYPDQNSATELAGALIKKRLAACAQLSPVNSFYCWEGKCHNSQEVKIIIKTRDALYPEIEKFIQAHHSYDLPQIIKLPIVQGLNRYLDWIDENTGGKTITEQ